ncbi:hypothetical protein [Deinococcus frigens]|uniref:hypothetical protein n=1 Tax=Deinococcus frigens TaxID=249403 RepID=UPI00049719B0|nr:hypothetical protein [Deinococcus frigens]
MPRRDEDGGAKAAQAGAVHSLDHLHELARLDAQRLGNTGAGLKVLEALMKLSSFRPKNGGMA